MSQPTFKATIIRVEVKGGQGAVGKSAYQSYLDTTSDDPPLSEEAWSLPSGGSSITFWPNGVISVVNPDDDTDVRFINTFENNPYP